jgi:hypothetical protein
MFLDILEAVRRIAQTATRMSVYIGSNPPAEAIGLDGDASTVFTGKDIDRAYEYRIAINGKSGDQLKIARELENIHKMLTLRGNYPQGDDWQIYGIETQSSPRILGRESADKNQWLYGSSVLVKYYRKGLKAL